MGWHGISWNGMEWNGTDGWIEWIIDVDLYVSS